MTSLIAARPCSRAAHLFSPLDLLPLLLQPIWMDELYLYIGFAHILMMTLDAA